MEELARAAGHRASNTQDALPMDAEVVAHAPPDRHELRLQLSGHILPTSGTMVGVCVTLIGLVKIAEAHIGPTRVDEYAALSSVLFLSSAITSYMSMRHVRRPRFSRRCEQIADLMFLVGLFSLSAVSLLFAYEVV